MGSLNFGAALAVRPGSGPSPFPPVFPSMNYRSLSAWAFVTSALGFAIPSQAAVDTIARIQQTHTITIGVRESAWPFSFVESSDKQAAGFTVDLCHDVVEEIKRSLNLKDLTVKYQLVTGANRIPKLESGDIDLECGSTTNTKARQEKVDFSYTFFVAGIRLLMPTGSHIETVEEMGGLQVALSKGTTSEKLFTQLSRGGVKVQTEVFNNNDEAYAALKSGKVRAFAQDDSLLQGMAAHDKAQSRYQVSELALSVEPYAIMVRKGDAGLLSLVDRTLAHLYSTRQIDSLYRKWFDNPQITLPMSRLTRDSYTRPNKEAGVARVLGYTL